jgi:catechol 2,3-dioxygenase-like lactoylglutathione lyase family enzyme
MSLERRVFVDHVTLEVADFARSRAFYEAALEPLGTHAFEHDSAEGVAFGPEGAEDFAIRAADSAKGRPRSGPLHIAFLAADREQVDRFHAAALAAGGTDNGGPGLRPQYHPGYYGAYVLDPDGNNVEAVFHDRG